jgi:hypothetical protein
LLSVETIYWKFGRRLYFDRTIICLIYVGPVTQDYCHIRDLPLAEKLIGAEVVTKVAPFLGK